MSDPRQRPGKSRKADDPNLGQVEREKAELEEEENPEEDDDPNVDQEDAEEEKAELEEEGGEKDKPMTERMALGLRLSF
jgi:hypothetical protein